MNSYVTFHDLWILVWIHNFQKYCEITFEFVLCLLTTNVADEASLRQKLSYLVICHLPFPPPAPVPPGPAHLLSPDGRLRLGVNAPLPRASKSRSGGPCPGHCVYRIEHSSCAEVCSTARALLLSSWWCAFFSFLLTFLFTLLGWPTMTASF